jgi:hypothetical protein
VWPRQACDKGGKSATTCFVEDLEPSRQNKRMDTEQPRALILSQSGSRESDA